MFDVSKMTVEELQQLINSSEEARRELKSRRDNERSDKIEEFKKTEKYKELVSRHKEIMKAARALSKKKMVGIEMTVPIKFKIKTEFVKDLNCNNRYEGDWFSFEHFYSNEVVAKIVNDKVFDKDQIKILQQGVERLVDGACGEIMYLFPEIRKEQEAIVDQYNKLMEEIDGLEVCTDFCLEFQEK